MDFKDEKLTDEIIEALANLLEKTYQNVAENKVSLDTDDGKGSRTDITVRSWMANGLKNHNPDYPIVVIYENVENTQGDKLRDFVIKVEKEPIAHLFHISRQFVNTKLWQLLINKPKQTSVGKEVVEFLKDLI